MREMDAKIDELVLGWPRTNLDKVSSRQCPRCGRAIHWPRPRPMYICPCEYSTDDEDAWKVVQAMYDKGYHVEMVDHGDGHYAHFMLCWADRSESKDKGSADGPSFAEAVCVAALRALGVD